MDLKYKRVPFHDVKGGGPDPDGDGSTFSGHCAVFHNCDAHGDVVLPGAFKDTLADFLANGQVLYDHGELIGKPIEAREDGRGLFIAAAISDTARGRDVKTLLRDGVLRSLSIGYRALARRPTDVEGVKAYWKSVGHVPTAEDLANLDDNSGRLAFLAAIRLYEASPVRFAANSQALVSAVKSGRAPRLSTLRLAVARLRDQVKSGRPLGDATRGRLARALAALEPARAEVAALLDESNAAAALDSTSGSKDAEVLARARAALALLSCDPVLSDPTSL